jgi:hypothetical protein
MSGKRRGLDRVRKYISGSVVGSIGDFGKPDEEQKENLLLVSRKTPFR